MGTKNIHFGKLALSILITQSAGLIGAVFTADSVGTWYATLNRPTFSPPNWVFGPVWTLLYTLIGIALYIVWVRHVGGHVRTLWLRVFWVQLALNMLWSFLFFGLQNPQLAFYEILILLGSIGFLTGLGASFDKRVALLLTPYLAWVSFAMYLNYSIWQLNY
jgi:tryptophan-rich sensory protein